MAFFGFGKKEKDKMKTGLEKTRTGFWGSIMNTLTGSVIDDEMYDDLEEKLFLPYSSLFLRFLLIFVDIVFCGVDNLPASVCKASYYRAL